MEAWSESVRNPDFDLVRERLTDAVIFDGRNIYNPEFLRSHGIGRR